MARPKSDFIKAMGTGWEIFLAIVNEVLALGGNDEQLRRILTSKTLRRQIAELIVNTTTKVVLTLTSLIEVGKYDWVNSDITEARFPMPENFTLGAEPKLYHLNRNISSEKAIEEMAKDGFRPATIWDLLDFGAKNPELQRQFPIVALGSVCRVSVRRFVACLGRDDSGRSLNLDWYGRGWGGGGRFLAVRNK